MGTIPDQMGHRPQESVTEAPSAHSPSLSEDALGTFFNGPRPPDPRPKTKAAGLSSARVGWRAARHQRSASVSFENGSSGNGQVHHQELEVGARPQRVEVGIAPHEGHVAVAGGDGSTEPLHGPLGLGLPLGGRHPRAGHRRRCRRAGRVHRPGCSDRAVSRIGSRSRIATAWRKDAAASAGRPASQVRCRRYGRDRAPGCLWNRITLGWASASFWWIAIARSNAASASAGLPVCLSTQAMSSMGCGPGGTGIP